MIGMDAIIELRKLNDGLASFVHVLDKLNTARFEGMEVKGDFGKEDLSPKIEALHDKMESLLTETMLIEDDAIFKVEERIWNSEWC